MRKNWSISGLLIAILRIACLEKYGKFGYNLPQISFLDVPTIKKIWRYFQNFGFHWEYLGYNLKNLVKE